MVETAAQFSDLQSFHHPVGGAFCTALTGACALLLSLAVFAVLCTVALDMGDSPGPAGGLDDGEAVGADLFTRYLVPFELLSVLLLGAIFGALAIARREERE